MPNNLTPEEKIYVESLQIRKKLNEEELAVINQKYDELRAQLSALTPEQRNSVKPQILYLNSLRIQKEYVENQQRNLQRIINGINNGTLTDADIRKSVVRTFGSKHVKKMGKYSARLKKLDSKVETWSNRVAVMAVKRNNARNKVSRWLYGRGLKISEHFEKKRKTGINKIKSKNELILSTNNIAIRRKRREASNLKAKIEYYNSRQATMRGARSRMQKFQTELNNLNNKGVKMKGGNSILVKQWIRHKLVGLWPNYYAEDGIENTKKAGIL